jgi:hypothetical protein
VEVVAETIPCIGQKRLAEREGWGIQLEIIGLLISLQRKKIIWKGCGIATHE